MSCTALLDFNFLISLRTVFSSTHEKQKIEKRYETLLMTVMFGWSLYISIAFKVGCLDEI